MKKVFLFACLALIFAACQESLEDRCARETKAFTAKKCPYKMDEFTIMDSLTFERSTHTIHYFYRLTGTADREGALDSIDGRGLLLKELKNTTDMKTYKDNGYNFAYTFHSNKNPKKLLFETTLTEKDYKLIE
jgi:ADP-ribose pyrophosphatase YjhB (NUDIX family)